MVNARAGAGLSRFLCVVFGVGAMVVPEWSVVGRAADGGAAVACLGRIIPGEGVIAVQIPASSFPGPPTVAEIRVGEGGMVKQGQVIAVLDPLARLEAAWKAALTQVDVAAAELARQAEGASPEQIKAAAAELERAEAEFEAAEAEHERNRRLSEGKAISEAAFLRSKLALQASRAARDAALHGLKNVEQVREVDVAVARARHAHAVAEAARAEQEVAQAYVRAPVSGLVLKILARPGERSGPSGVAELADISRMFVLAEVYETDALGLAPGQPAEIRSPALPNPLRGTVDRVGRKVQRNLVIDDNPGSMSDARVVEVRVRLEDAESAARLIHARVTVRIEVR